MFEKAGYFIDAYINKYPNSHYFDTKTLKFFGERISDMRLLKSNDGYIHTVTDRYGDTYNAYCLSSLQRKHPCGTTRVCTYFNVETLQKLYGMNQ